MKWVLIAVALLLGLVVLVTVVGMLLPVGHTASVSREVSGTPEEVWTVITDVDGFPEWRPGLARASRLEDRDGLPAWREEARTGTMTLEVTVREPPRRMVTRIADEGLPFGGTWTYSLEPSGRRTRLTLTEDGEVYNPVFRFLARFVFGHEGTMRSYLDGLETRMASRGAPGG